MAIDGCFDFRRLDAVPENLNLFVGAAEIGDVAVWQIARQVTGAIKASALFVAKRIANESFCGQVRAIAIAARHVHSPNVKFACLSRRNLTKIFIENKYFAVGNWLADGRQAAAA